MNIFVAGSFSFPEVILGTIEKLEALGHHAFTTDDIHDSTVVKAKESFEEELALCLEYDALRDSFGKIASADAILVCNVPKRGIEGYLGTSVLMELAVAYHLEKKLYLLHPFDKEQSYALEVAVMQPTIIDGDLQKIV